MTNRQFLKRLEEMYNKQYNSTQAAVIVQWCAKKAPRTLSLLFNELVRYYDGRFQLPLIRDMEIALTDIVDSAQLQLPSGAKQITDDAGWTDEEMGEALDKFKSIAGRVAAEKKVGRPE